MSKPPIIDITHPLILKDGELFFLCDHRGDIEPPPELGLGLFHRDCRYLRRYALSLGGRSLSVLMHSAREAFIARFELTNPPIETARERLKEHSLLMTRQQTLHAEWRLLADRWSVRNCTLGTLEFTLRLAIEANFEDVFSLRGAVPERRGRLRQPASEDGLLHLRYDGADGISRRLDIEARPRAVAIEVQQSQAEMGFALRLAPQETAEIDIALRITEVEAGEPEPEPAPAPDRKACIEHEQSVAAHWLDGSSRVDTGHPPLDRALHRSLADIRMLTIERHGQRFVAAGIPWYAGLFGRDSLAPSLQCLAYRPELAAHTLRALAPWQGRRHAEKSHEEPGKILHELRVGEMARLGEVDERPSYGSVDSTLVYLITLARHAEWTGSTALFEELIDCVESALQWMDRDGAAGGDGYIVYDNGTQGQPANQGWKDSADAVSYPDGRMVRGRVALVEVQGYAYLAKRLISRLYARIGRGRKAEQLAAEAQALKQRFNRDFWMADAGCYCMALDAERKQVALIGSNPGQALWSGIADPEKARATAARLMAPDMFSGWGIRTLSEQEARFNPIGYHNGSVWPFDNSLILAGFRRYGLDQLALRIFDGMVEAAGFFDESRLPEFFSGSARQGEAGPARCPRADPLQAWSAGALPYMLANLLGLQPDGFACRLRLVRPLLPTHVDRLTFRELRVGEATADLLFERRGDGIEVSVRHLQGRLEIES